MSKCVRYMNLVMVGEQWNHVSPRSFARHSETVQQHQGRLIGGHSRIFAGCRSVGCMIRRAAQLC
jgi:hypothetical protein